jgi:glucose-6-phosphate dehydrogenase assembly protein OpcA
VNNEVQTMKGIGMAMDNSTHPGMHLPWAGKKVPQEQVENELSSLWHLAADNMRISQNMNVRTNILNFVICALDVESAHKASMLLRDLSSTLIARVTLLILDTRSDLPSDVSTWVTLRSFPIISDIMRHHFEQITVTITGGAVQYTTNIMQTILKPDLPVYLWWLNDLPDDNSIFQRLIASSSRVIVDSSDFTHPEEHVRTLSELLQASPGSALSDLNWGRVTAWRELIAQFFDIAEYRPYLLNADQIAIEHAIPATSANQPATNIFPNAIEALLIAAWLKTRLGWQLAETDDQNYHDATTGTYSWHMTKRNTAKLVSQPLQLNALDTGSMHFSITPRPQTGSRPGSLCMVSITSTVNNKQASFAIKRGDDDDHVVTSVDIQGSTPLQRTVNIATAHKESELLHNELEIMKRDHLYEETLHEVFALLT